ncbi:ABC transporter ATP-binding protein [Leucobacter luti]|uniref:Amino acid/amide ABC transporter ATP-binding protein 1 (HAAT family) n=1 Tax=Leucobacter luti TaxID=340320 RepID=A0A4R6RTN4_9MICO|nr:ABC transporter ATP-binding protein [Leucobacter luti]QYM76016.1 ABC transporter ATP-binding protein [Leucobacter luti]TDP90261.1 amino acid/amide ABC transporter ATP-binding protein 1 (HAAT family) [Leucobacter luti]
MSEPILTEPPTSSQPRPGRPLPPGYPADREALRAQLRTLDQLPGVAKPDPILTVDRIERRFGGMTAVSVDHLQVQRGAITALIGPNGAGKTTFFNLLTGFDKASNAAGVFGGGADRARWSFEGRSLGRTNATKVARAGMIRTFQLTKALGRMTVLENMLIGAANQPGENLWVGLVKPLWAKRERENIERAEELLRRFKLDEKRNDMAGGLSGGQKKLLEMARALMTEPSMIMLDEPMAGVNPALTQSLLEHIQTLRDEGTTVLFVEHDMHMVRHISDWVVVMAQGEIIAEGLPEDVMTSSAVVDAYLGAHHDRDLGDDDVLTTGVIRAISEEVADEVASEAGEGSR